MDCEIFTVIYCRIDFVAEFVYIIKCYAFLFKFSETDVCIGIGLYYFVRFFQFRQCLIIHLHICISSVEIRNFNDIVLGQQVNKIFMQRFVFLAENILGQNVKSHLFERIRVYFISVGIDKQKTVFVLDLVKIVKRFIQIILHYLQSVFRHLFIINIINSVMAVF